MNASTDTFATGNTDIDEAVARYVEQKQGAAIHVMVCDSNCHVLETITGYGFEPFATAFNDHGVKYMGCEEEPNPEDFDTVFWYV